MYNIIQENRQNGKKGFTLAELLVVVAIVAVLVAISIPIFTAQLDKAQQATDAANVRAAKACAVTQYLTNNETTAKSYNYDADAGKVLDSATAPTKGYNKATEGSIAADKGYVVISIAAGEDTVTATWKSI